MCLSFFFVKQKTAYDMLRSLVGSEMCIRDSYYPTFEDKLTHLFYVANKSHSFQDGNKRIAITVGSIFLLKNGYINAAKEFLYRMEIISYHVAASNIDKELLHEIITSILNEADFSEELKLKIACAISQDGQENEEY